MVTRRERLQSMLAKNPNDPFLHYGLAMELAKEGDTVGALERFDEVLRLDGRYVAAHYHKASTLVAVGRVGEARSVLTAGVAAAQAKGDSHAEGELRGLLESLG